MADILIKGIRELTAPHTIHVSNVGLDGVKDGFKAWDSAAGCAYEVVEVPTHGRPIDADKLYKKVKTECNPYGKPSISYVDDLIVLDLIDDAPTVIEASEDGEQDGKL